MEMRAGFVGVQRQDRYHAKPSTALNMTAAPFYPMRIQDNIVKLVGAPAGCALN
jgi:hypothetical protein